MTSLPPAPVKPYPEDSIEKKAYGIAESLSQFLPIMNDRNRLGFNLYRHLKGEGDDIPTIVKTNKFTIENITKDELIELIQLKVDEVKKELLLK
ncbi:MAG: hypothetical protein N3F03_06705 [Ignavibacteria bacterium]|nr:hypothetical protein [Ignavibacteria bacterium]